MRMCHASSVIEQVAKENGIALFVKRHSGVYTYINEPGARMVHRAPAEILSRGDSEIFKQSSAEFMSSRDRWIMQSDKHRVYDAIAETSLGWRRYFTAKVRIQDQSLAHLVGLSVDITESRDAHAVELIKYLIEGIAREPNFRAGLNH